MEANATFSTTPLNGKNSAILRLYIPALLFVMCLAAQLYLVFNKSFNWDEFLHFGMVFKLKADTLIQPFQVFHLRMLWWAPEVATNLVDQMVAARLFIWSMHILTLAMIFGVARQFTSASNSFFAAFAYLTAGYVFTQGFSIRADPLVSATLMSALYLMARGKLGLLKAIIIGALVGLAGMMTVKAMFYAPCFAGLAWLKSSEESKRREFLGKLAILVASAALSFWAIYRYHTWNFPVAASPLHKTSFLEFFLRWLTVDWQFASYVVREAIFALLFFISIVLAPRAWAKAGLRSDEKIALAGFIAPIIVLVFYRNTFPYFFTFILAPVAVAIAPALGLVRERYGNTMLSVMLAAVPLTFAVLEPREVIGRQRALIDYVHQEFPEKSGYLDYSGMIADYPRILEYLTSGNGLRLYREHGLPIIATEIDRGNVPFIIANQKTISAALENRPMPNTFLPADLTAISGNYVQQWGVLWREGAQIPEGAAPFQFQLRRGGSFILAGDDVTIDGITVTQGTTIELTKGRHQVGGGRHATSILWRGDRLPATPPAISMDSVFTNF